MASGALREDEDAGENDDGEDRRGEWPADVETAAGDRLVEQVADGGTERSRQDERRPEEQHMRDPGPEIEHEDNCQHAAEDQRAGLVAKPEARRDISGRSRDPI